MKEKNDLFTKKDILVVIAKNQIVFLCICLIFYKNFLVSLIISFLSLVLYKRSKLELIRKRKENILNQFKMFIDILLATVSTGDDLYNAYVVSYNEFTKISNDKNFITSLKNGLNCLQIYNDLNKAFEIAFKTYNVDELDKFCDSVSLTSTMVGNMRDVIINVSDLIIEKINLQNDIKKIFYEKKLEMKTMIVIPILIYLFMSITAPDYVLPLYESLKGYMIITLCLILMLIAYIMGEKMMNDIIEEY